PWQLCGYGRGDWSTKLIRGLISEAAAGFRSRLGPSHDSTLVTPHNAPFSTYKTARVHHAPGRRGGDVAAWGEGGGGWGRVRAGKAARGKLAPGDRHRHKASHARPRHQASHIGSPHSYS